MTCPLSDILHAKYRDAKSVIISPQLCRRVEVRGGTFPDGGFGIWMRDMEAEHNEALGFVTRSGDWGAETWESVANDPLLYAHRPGLVIQAKAIAAEMRRQEAEHEVS